MTDAKPDLPRWPEVLVETCPTCGGQRTWSSHQLSAVYAPPASHTVRHAPDGSRYDTCPKEATAS